MTTPQLLVDRAARFGSRRCLTSDAGSLSFAELLRGSARVAACLRAGRTDLGEARVAYLIPPGLDHVVVQWGIWQAGGIAVPLALSHPARELEHILDDADPICLVVAAELTERIAPLARARDIAVVEGHAAVGFDASAPPVTLGPTRRALMVYTSGTTGRPKGVVTTHGNVAAQVATLSAAWGWTEADCSLHVLPLHHIHGIINALSCALWSGASVELHAGFEPLTCWDRLASGAITFFTAVPTIYSRLIAAFDEADPATQRRWAAGVRRVRLMLSGSAALPVAVLTRWETLTGHRLLERYGMTEIGMALSNPLDGERRAGTVGQPLPGVEARLVDETGNPVPPGAPGQIEVRGAQVFGEYWRRPEETARAFRDGWFMTGDVAQVDDGYWRILGRASVDIIKSAGYKISALEIEEVLREHPLVVDCAVVGRPDPDLGERIGAVIVTRSELTPPALRTWLGERLAPYKVPRDFVFADALPTNPMGKVIKPALAPLFPDRRPT